MKRMRVIPRKDKRIFASTAKKTREINLPVLNSRGGIRL